MVRNSFKEIFSDSNNIFFMTWIKRYEQRKSSLPKFRLIPIFRLQDCAWLCCVSLLHLTTVLNQFLWMRIYVKNVLKFTLKWFQLDTNNSNFESTLYMISLSMPLISFKSTLVFFIFYFFFFFFLNKGEKCAQILYFSMLLTKTKQNKTKNKNKNKKQKNKKSVY